MDSSRVSERARYLKLAALSLAEGMRAGSFKSAFRGRGVDFDGVREYERGDDIRSIDWNVTARMGKPFVKLWREERELVVFVVLDLSLSMHAGSRSRRDQAVEAAALIAFAAEQTSSPLGSVVFDGAVGPVFKPRVGKDQVLAVVSSFDHFAPRERGSALASALAGAARALRNRSLVVAISDFRVDGYEKELGILARKHDVLAVRVVSPTDEALPDAGYLPFRDPETGVAVSYPTSSRAFREAWAREHREGIHRWEHLAARRGVANLVLSTEDDAALVLTRFFSGPALRGGDR